MTAVSPTKDVFTCITCRVGFKDGELQRLHYKTDWHRYNLKRKVAELPPVTAEDFQIRVYNQRNADELQYADKSVYCDVCRKSFGNKNAFDNHFNSRKHKDNERHHHERGKKSEYALVNIYNPVLVSESSDIRSKDSEINSINAELDSDSEVEEIDSDDWDIENPIDNNDCLFCPHHSRNFIKNLEHMTIVHSFFIPDIEYCLNMTGLLRYLGEKITEGK